MIGYYVHHHGTGHLAHATALAQRSPEPVVALSSLPEPAVGHPFAAWVRLADDPHLGQPDDPRAGGALHWAPCNSPGYRERMASLAAWLTREHPRLLVVDVSVEVTVLARTLGHRVVTVALPGERDDAAHALAVRMSSLVLAPWPRAVYEPDHLRRAPVEVVYLGALSRFDGRPAAGAPQDGTVQVLAGSGGGGAGPDELAALAAATGRLCRGAGGRWAWEPDVWAALCSADVVITHAGLGAIAETAAARRPAVVIPERRPFREQHATARALRDAGLATVLDAWPEPGRWPQLLAEAGARGGDRWAAWHDGRAADRAAERLAGLR